MSTIDVSGESALTVNVLLYVGDLRISPEAASLYNVFHKTLQQPFIQRPFIPTIRYIRLLFYSD